MTFEHIRLRLIIVIISNIALKLPFLRTSVDYGTTFDIAGENVASARSLVEAIDMAVNLAV